MRSKPFTLWMLVLAFALAGNRIQCGDRDLPNVRCDPIGISLDPGECAPLVNTCVCSDGSPNLGCIGGGAWLELDSLGIRGAPAGVTLHTMRDPRARSICVSPFSAPGTTTIDMCYQAPGILGESTIALTIHDRGPALDVTASATPSFLSPGESSQLDAAASGGVPPYTYAWSPPFFLDATDIPNPVATPPFSISYAVNVTDDAGTTVQAQAPINVGFDVDVSATPPSIAVGQTTLLGASPVGGTPPFTYGWTPLGSLDDATLPSPTASPTTTTAYDVTVTDATGNTASGRVTVAVAMQASATATPSTLLPGESTVLGVAVAGGLPPYTFDWAPAQLVDDPTAPGPTATPPSTTVFNVVATDAAGAQASAAVTVTVDTGVVTADLVVELEPLRLFLDGSFSSGPITEYRWWCDFAGSGQPPDLITPTPFAQCDYQSPGTVAVRLEVRDAASPPNLSSVQQVIDVP